MRRITLAVFAAATLSAGAIENAAAQDILYSPRSVANWTGVYVGANVGYGWAHLSASATSGGVTASGSENLNGYVAGGEAGVNIQTGPWVWGLEADIQATGQKISNVYTGGGATITTTEKLPWFGTGRVRTGYAVDRWLIYVTGGVGVGQFKSDGAATGTIVGSYSYSTTRAAWVAGAGVEAMIDRNLSWKAEYLHLDSGTITNSAGSIATSVKLADEILRFGLNYKFP
jgi:outer membrane immunogenic protein